MALDGAGAPEEGADERDVIVIGAGFAGLCAGVRLKEAGRDDFEIWEKAAAVGGTWRDNTYPGCACDVPSHLYSFSFALNPDWSRAFSPAPEIQAYLERCTDEFGLRPHVRLNTELVSAAWDETSARWRLKAADGRETTCRVLIVGQGPLNKPAYPEIEGLETFEGEAFHSMHWRHDLDFSDRRVAVIGTGASAIQFVPWLADNAAHVTVCQRTPPWILPKRDRVFSDAEKARFRSAPIFKQIRRWLTYGSLEWRAAAFAAHPKLMSVLGRPARKFLEEQVPDPELRAKLTPNYTIGCKRVLLSNDYYPALMKPHVDLVTEPIARATPTGLVFADGREIEVDAIVYGTGFRATDMLGAIEFVGEGGRRLSDEWADGEAEAFYGLSVAGYPNLFYLVGPNTGLGHNSIVYMIESQMNFVMDALELLDREGADALVVKQDVQAAHNADLQERMKRSVWQSGCTSWYQTKSGKNVTLWPGFTIDYRRRTKHVRPEDVAFVRAKAAV